MAVGTERWTIEQVAAVAPARSRLAAAEALAVPVRWTATGADDAAVWGRCRGSGREPYDVTADHLAVAWRCSCPSRSQPCKHVLALLLMWVRGQVGASAAPVSVTAWLRRQRRDVHAGPVPVGPAVASTDDTRVGTGAGTDATDPAQPAAVRSHEAARDDRVARLRDGLFELDRWLDDRIRTGLSDPSLGRYATWDNLAARLVDARAGALANRVRRLAGVVGARPDWHDVVLAELGILHLLAQAGRRLSELPGPLADAVATACGWQVRQADVLAGVPDTDTWIVAGRSDTREDRIEVRRVWLWGTRSRRWAMVLSFAAYRQPLDASLAVGAAVTADVHRYPGPSVRALVGLRHDRPPHGGGRGDGPGPAGVAEPAAPPARTVHDACAAVGRWLAAEPWTDRVPVTVRAAPTVGGGHWLLADDTGSVALAPAAPGLPVLLAASAGHPVDVTVEWTLDGAVPLTVHLPDRALDIGPLADPSFVSAA